MKVFRGSKFFRYDENNNLEILRVYAFNNSKDSVKCYKEDGSKVSITTKDLKKFYKLLNPDGVFSMVLMDTVSGMPDVLISLHRFSDGPMDDNRPFAICRQNVADFFSNIGKDPETQDMLVGVSVNWDSCLPNIEFTDLLMCSNVKEYDIVYIYLDDTIDSILKVVKTRKYDNALRHLKNDFSHYITERGNQFIGYTDSVEQLLKENKFIHELRYAFGVIEIPFSILEEDERLTPMAEEFFAKEIGAKVTRTYVIPYSREIDRDSFVRKHKLATSLVDGMEKIFIVGYDEIEE